MIALFERILQGLGLLAFLQFALTLAGTVLGLLVFGATQCFAPPIDERIPDDYTATSDVHFANAEEERMIQLAEAAYPPRDAVVALATLDGGALAEEIPETEAWWYAWDDGIQVPYAVTAGALEYYEGLIAQYKADPAKAPWDRASCTYAATVEYHKTIEKQGVVLEDVYIVKMNLMWSSTAPIDSENGDSSSAAGCCLGECQSPDVYFQKQRTVILKSTGEVLNVFGDGRTYTGYYSNVVAKRFLSKAQTIGGACHV